MPDFIQFCNTSVSLDAKTANAFKEKCFSKSFNKGDFLLKTGQVCKQFYYINSGLVKLFFNNGEKEFIMRFFPQNIICTELESYILQAPSAYAITAIEPTIVTYISYTDFELLCKTHHSIETLYRKFVSMASINMMKRVSEMLEENAFKRYHNFIKENNDLLQRLSLGDLANYLGITQVSLSRIRAKR